MVITYSVLITIPLKAVFANGFLSRKEGREEGWKVEDYFLGLAGSHKKEMGSC
jgi:hypothetical protein